MKKYFIVVFILLYFGSLNAANLCSQVLNSSSSSQIFTPKTLQQNYQNKESSSAKPISKKVLAILSSINNSKSWTLIKGLNKVYGNYKITNRLTDAEVLLIDDVIYEGFHKLHAQQVVFLLEFYSKIRFSPSDEVLGLITAHLTKNMSKLKFRDLSSVIFVYGKFGAQLTPKFFDAWFKRFYQLDKTNLKGSDLSISLYGLALAGKIKDKRVSQLLEMVNKHQRFKARNASAISLVANYMKYVLNDENKLLSKFAKPLVLEKLGNGTLLEKNFEKLILKPMTNGRHIREYLTEAGTRVDFYVEETNTIYQIDGPTHYIKNVYGKPPKQRQNDIFMDEIHKALGYNVTRVSYVEVDEIALQSGINTGNRY